MSFSFKSKYYCLMISNIVTKMDNHTQQNDILSRVQGILSYNSMCIQDWNTWRYHAMCLHDQSTLKSTCRVLCIQDWCTIKSTLMVHVYSSLKHSVVLQIIPTVNDFLQRFNCLQTYQYHGIRKGWFSFLQVWITLKWYTKPPAFVNTAVWFLKNRVNSGMRCTRVNINMMIRK